MKRWLIYGGLVLAAYTGLQAETALEADDIQALREWINTKRQVTVRELGGQLSLSGEVHAEMQSSSEFVKGVQQRGSANTQKAGRYDYDIEFVLLLDYKTERSWANIRLRFNNNAGIIGGTNKEIKLDKAYFGVRLLDRETYTTDIEIGRRKMSQFLDSKIEFGSIFDGILLRGARDFESVGNLYAYVGTFVINEKFEQYGYVGEIGLLQIANTGFSAKYSLIDWDTKGYKVTPRDFEDPTKLEKARPTINEQFDFVVSQVILGYRYTPPAPHSWWKKVTYLYAAGLYNHMAKEREITAHKKANWGAYAGFLIGETKKQGDWSFDANYQLAAAQVIPSFDSQGIGLGNVNEVGFYSKKDNGLDVANNRKNAQGGVNYRGYQFTLNYLLTNNLMLQQLWLQSCTLDSDIGPYRRYNLYELEFVYTW